MLYFLYLFIYYFSWLPTVEHRRRTSHWNNFQTQIPAFYAIGLLRIKCRPRSGGCLYQETWARGQSRARGGQVSHPAFADWGRWAAVLREKSCLDTREGIMFWKLLSEWVSRAVSQGTGACQREEQIVLLFFSLLLLRSIIHYLEVRHQPWEAFFWVEYFLTFLFLRKFSSLPCFCFVKACMWQRGLEEKTEQANTLSLQAWPKGAFPFQAGKAAAITTLFIRTHWNLSPFRDISFHFLSSILYFTGIRQLFSQRWPH